MRGRASVQQSNLREEGSQHTTPKNDPILSFSVILSFSRSVSYMIKIETKHKSSVINKSEMKKKMNQ